MRQQLHITVPVKLTKHIVSYRELRKKYETNRLLPLYDTFLILKNYAGQPGLIKTDFDIVASLCKISFATLKKRIDKLNALGWLSFLHQGSLAFRLHSWKQIYNQQELNYNNEFTTIIYEPDNKYRLLDQLFALEIEQNKLAQAKAWKHKIDSNLENKSILTCAMIMRGADRYRLEKDFTYFTSYMQKLYIEDFKFGSSFRDVIQLYRPFFERGIKAMAKAYLFKSKQSVCYRKKIMQQRGVVRVEKVQHTSNIRGRNKYCKVMWDPKKQETILCMADTIKIVKPKENERHAAAA